MDAYHSLFSKKLCLAKLLPAYCLLLYQWHQATGTSSSLRAEYACWCNTSCFKLVSSYFHITHLLYSDDSTWGQVYRCLKTSRWILNLFFLQTNVKMPTFYCILQVCSDKSTCSNLSFYISRLEGMWMFLNKSKILVYMPASSRVWWICGSYFPKLLLLEPCMPFFQR